MAEQRGKAGTRPNNELERRTRFVIIVCGLLACFLIYRLFEVMILNHSYYEELAVNSQTRETSVMAHRGTITDRNGNVLAINASAETVFISPHEISERREDVTLIADFLSELLDVDRQYIVDRCRDTEYWYVVIARAQPSEITDQIKEFKSENNITGIHLETTSKRYYPNNNLACHILGFVGTDGDGLMGIESLYNSYLRGNDGSIIRMKTEDGNNMLFTNYEYYFDAEDGCTVETTVDNTIQ